MFAIQRSILTKGITLQDKVMIYLQQSNEKVFSFDDLLYRYYVEFDSSARTFQRTFGKRYSEVLSRLRFLYPGTQIGRKYFSSILALRRYTWRKCRRKPNDHLQLQRVFLIMVTVVSYSQTLMKRPMHTLRAARPRLWQ